MFVCSRKVRGSSIVITDFNGHGAETWCLLTRIIATFFEHHSIINPGPIPTDESHQV